MDKGFPKGGVGVWGESAIWENSQVRFLSNETNTCFIPSLEEPDTFYLKSLLGGTMSVLESKWVPTSPSVLIQLLLLGGHLAPHCTVAMMVVPLVAHSKKRCSSNWSPLRGE